MGRRTNSYLAAALFGLGFAVARHAWRRLGSIDFFDRSVVIFGGSRGLGLVIARQLAAEGARLTLVARDADELRRAREDLDEDGTTALTIVCDVRNRHEVEHAITETVRRQGGIDVLINDAGIIDVGPLDHMRLEDFENMMATHFWGPLYAILAARPHLRASLGARIVNISSIGGRIAVPHLLTYSASKFALTGLSEGLSTELAREGIKVTTVSPGLMRTGSTYNAHFRGRHRLEFAWFHTAGSLPGLSIDGSRAARQIIDACRRGDPSLVITFPARLAVLLSAVCPNTTVRVMRLVNALLPPPRPEMDAESRSGWQSVSAWAPSLLTSRADQATTENNELPDPSSA